MNERIQELARRVVGRHRNDSASVSLFDEQIEQFAELIVKECVEQIYPRWIKDHKHIDPTNLADAVMRVKEHFGTE